MRLANWTNGDKLLRGEYHDPQSFAEDLTEALETSYDSGFTGGTAAQARTMLRDGDRDSVSKALELTARAEVEVEAIRREVEHSVVGGVPVVPIFLSGSPYNMRRMVPDADQFAPITIAVDMFSSGGLSANVVLNRGIACLALAQALSASRPVRLLVCYCSDHYGPGWLVTADVGHAPWDMARAMALLNPNVTRRGMMGLRKKTSKKMRGSTWHGGGARDLSRHVEADLYVTAAHLKWGSELRRDPLEWVKARAREILEKLKAD